MFIFLVFLFLAAHQSFAQELVYSPLWKQSLVDSHSCDLASPPSNHSHLYGSTDYSRYCQQEGEQAKGMGNILSYENKRWDVLFFPISIVA